MGSYPWGPHGPQSTPNQVTPNPTPAYVPPPAAPTYYPPAQQSYGQPSGAYYGGAAQSTGYAPAGPRKKSYVLALILTLLFGPLGLLYASKKGALVMLMLLFAVPITLAAMGTYRFVPASEPWRVIQYDRVMNGMYSSCLFFCLIWAVIGVYRRNKSVG
jgi:hypothetical protein